MESWSKLLLCCDYRSIFLTPEWQRSWWRHFGGGELLLLDVRQEGKLAGVVPLMKEEGTLSLLGSGEVCDYLDFIAPPEHAGGVCQAALDLIDSMEWTEFRLFSLTSHSVVLEHFVPLAKEKGYAVQIEQEGTSPRLDLPSTWEDYFMLLGRKQRHELRRKLRRLFSEGHVSCYPVSDAGGLGSDMNDFLTMFRNSHEGKADFLTPTNAEFFNGMAASLFRSGFLRLFFLEIGGVRVAAVLGFDYGDSFYLYNSGYDPEYSRLSVGLLLKALCIKESIARGKKHFDFLRGSEPYKYNMGGRDQPIYRCVLTRN